MQKIDIFQKDAEMWCPSCGIKNVGFAPEFELLECPHFESLGSSLTMGEYEFDRNKFFAAAWNEIGPASEAMESQTADSMLSKREIKKNDFGNEEEYDETAHWLSVLDEKLSDDYVLFVSRDTGGWGRGYLLYNLGRKV